jgi:hypothetical protein
MSRTRMWIFEEEQHGATDRKFSVDDPLHVPRIGEFVDSDKAAGWVKHVQYYYMSDSTRNADLFLVVNVYLGEKK